MYKKYAKYDEEMSKLGLWALFITLLVIFIWLIYEFYQSFSNEPTYRWELSFNIVGLPFSSVTIKVGDYRENYGFCLADVFI